jgi:hypothetical protein
VSFHVNTYDVEKINPEKMKNSFLPNLIHSIDGSVMRLIAKKVMDKGYIINHLHDSIQAHPNKIEIVHNSIKLVYTSGVFDNFLDENVFLPMRNSLLKEKHCKFDDLVKIFKNEYENVKINFDDFKPEDMYPFE